MHDLKAIREQPDAFDRACASRGLEPQAPGILEADRRHRAVQTALQTAQSRRNEASKLIGAAKAKKDEARAAKLMAEVEELKGEIARLTDEERRAAEAVRELVAALPNAPAPDVPVGADERDNLEFRRWGQPPAIADPKDHVDLGEALGMMDFEAAARMSGARFVVLKGQLARLERALGRFMLDLQTEEFGYTEVSPPLLVRDQAMFGTGQLPKFADDQFLALSGFEELNEYAKGLGRTVAENVLSRRAGEGNEADVQAAIEAALRDEESERGGRALDELTNAHWLIPTAEVSLTNIVREQILSADDLPLRYTALTPCFRAEAGASGRDTRGMIRQHQFWKCELVSITAPEQSDEEHERMTAAAEAVLKRLELPYRVVLLCTGDMGFSARKTYDLEVWLPSQNTYREISSCSNCGDFQARRMDARFRRPGEKGAQFVHTLNGSGLAVGRTLVAVMENYQDDCGRIVVPEVLRPYMGGLTHIGGAG